MTVSKNITNLQGPELLMPAGSLQKLEYAYAFGADAAYVGIPIFSLRARENDFGIDELYKARELSRTLGRKLYLTVNIFSKNRKLGLFRENLDELVRIGPDAVIMSDPGLMMIARERYPDLNIHLSVQANCMNWESVRFWKRSLNISRIILSRELHLDEIREIKDRVPDIELEAFVHGSICIAYSGRCLMSSYMSHRDANQGVCDNSCREKFNVFQSDKALDGEFYIEDLRNKGEFYQMSEDENGSYLMNAKDLRLIEYLREIHAAGVCSFKVEGRTKSVNYVALVTRAYRAAIDDMMAGRPFDPSWLTELEKVANRGYDTGFMLKKQVGAISQNYDTSTPRNFTQRFAGVITQAENTPEGYVPIDIRSRIQKGKSYEFIQPGHIAVDLEIQDILDAHLRPVDEIHGGRGVHFIKPSTPVHAHYGILSSRDARP